MKTQELKEIIRSVIKEELQKTLPTLIPNILSEILTGQNKNVVSEKLETPKVSQKPSENIQPAKKTFKKYTNNDVLNAVLNFDFSLILKEENLYATKVMITSQNGSVIKFEGKFSM